MSPACTSWACPGSTPAAQPCSASSTRTPPTWPGVAGGGLQPARTRQGRHHMPNADEHAPAAANAGQQPPKPAAALGSLTTGDAMTGTATGLGTFSWVDRTGGQLSAAERRSLLRPLA